MAVAPNPEYMQNLLETFKCFICMEKIQDARLCPHCSKLCCYVCISRWLTEQRSQCPHCRATLHLHEIVTCRWVEDLSDQLDSLNSTANHVESARQNQDPRCKMHDEQLTVFCVTCNSTICHRCALFDGSAHSGHSFRPVEEMYYDLMNQLGESCDNLKTKQRLIKKDIKELDKNIKEIHQAKEQKVLEIRTAVECMMLDLDKDLNNKLTTLLTQKNHLVNESEQIKEILYNCELELAQMPMSQLINNAPIIERTISAIQKKQTPVLKSVYPDFHSEIIPKYEGGTLVIKSFPEKMIKNEPIYSLPIGCNGVSWRLKVYPNGNGVVRDRYLSVFLELTSGPSGVSRYEYRIEMIAQAKTNEESKNLLREFTSDFEIGECWGYNRFFRLDLLHSEGFLVRDSLMFKFSVRPPTYYQKCREQQWYLSKLELDRSVLLQQFDELKQIVAAKVKLINEDLPSPKKKNIKIQSLLDEFKCAEPTENIDKDEEVPGASGETISNLLQPPLALHLLTMYNNDFQSSIQDESAQSMLERLSRIFEESNNPNEVSFKNIDVDKLSLDNIVDANVSEPSASITYTMAAPIDHVESGSETNLNYPTTPDRGSHNPIIFKNERTTVQDTDDYCVSNSFLNLSPIANIIDGTHSVSANFSFDGDWDHILSSSSDDEENPINESVGPDHLARDL